MRVRLHRTDYTARDPQISYNDELPQQYQVSTANYIPQVLYTPLESNHYSKGVTHALKVVSLTLQSNGYSLQSVGYSPGVLNPPYTGNSLEWWLLFIFNSVAFSVVIVGYTSELAFTNAEPMIPSRYICYSNPGAYQSGHHICNNGVAAAVSSILVCMMLLNFDVFIPCLDKMF
ncbi:uncharacterized protein [Dysidea avara]|uniref:uncharacterized protein n=1 Tax=Dysidea avara TaxID=196820 RepID=UPI0033176A15